MKTPILMKVIVFALIVVSLSGCKHTESLEEPESKVFNEKQPTATVVAEGNQKEIVASTLTETWELLKEELTIPLDEFSLAVEITHSGLENVDFDLLQSLGVKFIRFNGILWSNIQPTEDVYSWDGMLKNEDFFRKANQYGMTIIPIVRGTPVWAQKVYGYYCGAILDEKLESFGLFMKELVNRYSTEEYNIHYWEIWNEPDVQPEFVKNTSQYGCWGDENDPYYGGGNYANMLKVISPVIKDSDKNSKILIGGLLLDCDPEYVGELGRCQSGKDKPPKFLEGILLHEGGEYFDIVSYHGYVTDRSFERAPWDLEEKFFSWSARGGVVMGKYHFITELLSDYGLEKEVFLTETGYLCLDTNSDCINDLDKFKNRQAQYGVWLLIRNWVEGIDQSFWYQYNGPGWRQGGILDKEQQPKPVYSSLQILNERMHEAQTAQKLTDLPDGLQGYEIVFEEKTTWVVVSTDNASHKLDLSTFSFSAFDVFNNEIESQNGILEIFNPVYIDFDM